MAGVAAFLSCSIWQLINFTLKIPCAILYIEDNMATTKIVTKGYVYKISTQDGTKCYIGSSGIPPHLRFSCHSYSARTGKMPALSQIFAAGTPIISILQEYDNISKADLRKHEQRFLESHREQAVNVNDAVFDRLAFNERQRAQVECESCGKSVQRMYLRRHMEQKKCKEHDLLETLKAFGRLPCTIRRQKTQNRGTTYGESVVKEHLQSIFAN